MLTRGELTPKRFHKIRAVFTGLGPKSLVQRSLVAMAVAFSPAGMAHAADLPAMDVDPIRAAFFDDATFTLHMRSYLFDLSHNGEDNPAAWALGGWAGYQTGWIGDILQFGAVAYTSQPLWAPQDREGSLLLLPDQDGFSVLGQAYAALRYDDQVLTLYRQMVDQPEVNPHDNRMVPNTFEGVSLAGELDAISYYAAYLTRMKTRDSDDFVNMAKIAGVDQDEPMYLGGLSFTPNKDFTAQTSLYVVPNLLASSYTDGKWITGDADGNHISLSGQFMIQGGIGEELMMGPGFESWMAGIMGEVRHGDITLMAGYTANGTDNDWQTPYGMWPGYTNMIIGVFDWAGEQAVLLGATYDFAGLGLDGLTVSAQTAFDTHIADDRAKRTEYDFYVDYSFSGIRNAPDWLSPLSLRGRYAILQSDNLGPRTDDTDTNPVRLDSDEIRIIMNYEVKFSGKDL